MVYRYSWLAALAALIFAFLRLGDLLRPTQSGPPWQFVVFAGLLLGAVITWTALSYRLPTWLALFINAIAYAIAAFRIAVPDTTRLFLPTGESLSKMAAELDLALDIIRTNISPVLPTSGVVVVVTGVFWAAGVVVVWGLLRGHPYAALLPIAGLGLQLSTMDRIPAGLLSVVVFVSIVAFVFLAVRADHREQGVGRMTSPGRAAANRRWPALGSMTLVGTTIAVAVVASSVLTSTGVVPFDGVLTWRTSTGLTSGFYGSVTYNPFISIRSGLVSQSPRVVFTANLQGDVSPDEVYFRLVTMEHFDGVQFSALRPEVRPLDETWESPNQAFIGPTRQLRQDIQIVDLVMDWIPGAYSPQEVGAERDILTALRVRSDGSLILDGGRTFRGLTYSVTSSLPEPDLEVLATNEAGQLSPSFGAAADAGEMALRPAEHQLRELSNPDVYLELPDEMEESIGATAAEVTANLETNYEKGLALEAFFRGPSFTYSTDVSEGHGVQEIAEWINDESSAGYRTGYCEQFATSMAVMARTLDIPSRVVLGFTPGERVAANTVVVRDSNAHAWVELWMPSQGWVRFDPTPRSDQINPSTVASLPLDITPFLDLPAPERQEVATAPLPPQELFLDQDPRFVGSGGADAESSGFTVPGWLRWLIPAVLAGVALFAAVPGLKYIRRRRRLKRLRNGDITAAWEEIVSRLTDFGEQPKPSLTPWEVADTFDPAMGPLATVYGESIYGPPDRDPEARLVTATRSFESTESRLTTKYSKVQRVVAWYRPGTIIPRWLRRLNERRRGNRRNGG